MDIVVKIFKIRFLRLKNIWILKSLGIFMKMIRII